MRPSGLGPETRDWARNLDQNKKEIRKFQTDFKTQKKVIKNSYSCIIVTWCCKPSKIKGNLFFTTNSDRSNPFFFATKFADLRYINLRIMLDQIILILKCQWFTPSGFNDIGIRKFILLDLIVNIWKIKGFVIRLQWYGNENIRVWDGYSVS